MISSVVYGHVGNDPEMKHVGQNSTPVVKFSIASNSPKKDGPTTWVRVSYFGERALAVADYIHKGDRILAVGDMELRSWEANGKSGTDLELNATNVRLVEKKDEGRSAPSSSQQRKQPRSAAPTGRGTKAPF